MTFWVLVERDCIQISSFLLTLEVEEFLRKIFFSWLDILQSSLALILSPMLINFCKIFLIHEVCRSIAPDRHFHLTNWLHALALHYSRYSWAIGIRVYLSLWTTLKWRHMRWLKTCPQLFYRLLPFESFVRAIRLSHARLFWVPNLFFCSDRISQHPLIVSLPLWDKLTRLNEGASYNLLRGLRCRLSLARSDQNIAVTYLL